MNSRLRFLWLIRIWVIFFSDEAPNLIETVKNNFVKLNFKCFKMEKKLLTILCGNIMSESVVMLEEFFLFQPFGVASTNYMIFTYWNLPEYAIFCQIIFFSNRYFTQKKTGTFVKLIADRCKQFYYWGFQSYAPQLFMIHETPEIHIETNFLPKICCSHHIPNVPLWKFIFSSILVEQ